MSMISFLDWDLPEYILDAIAGQGWENPTEIQRKHQRTNQIKKTKNKTNKKSAKKLSRRKTLTACERINRGIR